jgi:uncharacterized protein YlxP (DUF503 family)
MIAKLIRERILTVPHTVREVPPAEREEIRIEQTLLGWVLHLGRDTVSCDTEAEARYLAAFAKLDYTEVIIPRRADHIAAVIADVEREVEEVLTYIDSQTETERHTGRQRELLHLVLENVRDRIEKALHVSVRRPSNHGKTGSERGVVAS